MVDYFLATSNKEKIKQYHMFGCPYPGTGGPDLKEPDADIVDIVAYKARMAGPGAVVEDTCLHIENCPYPGNLIRFIEATLDNYQGEKAIFEVALARNNGKEIEVFMGHVHGHIVKEISGGQAYGFDGSFVPEGNTKTIWELKQDGDIITGSARKVALDNMMSDKAEHVVTAENIGWNGPWQDDEVDPLAHLNIKTQSKSKLEM